MLITIQLDSKDMPELLGLLETAGNPRVAVAVRDQYYSQRATEFKRIAEQSKGTGQEADKAKAQAEGFERFFSGLFGGSR